MQNHYYFFYKTIIKETRRTALFAYSLLATFTITAQSVFKPSAEQQKVLDKAIPKIILVLDQFTNNDWEKSQDYYDGNPMVSKDPNVPLDINGNFERDYVVNQHSDRFNLLLKPIYDRITGLMQQQPVQNDSVLALGKKLKALSHLYVYVYINRQNPEIKPDPATDRKITGVAFVHKAPGSYMQSNDGFSYYLAFGKWNTAKWDASHKWLHYTFNHPKFTPYIENLVVIITGAEDRIQELLGKIDWNSLNDALTN